MSAREPVRGHGFVIAAFVASLSLVGVLAMMPMVSTVQESAHVEVAPGTEGDAEAADQRGEVRHHTLAEAQGWGAVAAITAPPILLTGLALLLRRGASAVVVRVVSSVLLLAAVVLGALSIGVFYLPGAMLMLVAATLALGDRAWRRERPTVRAR